MELKQIDKKILAYLYRNSREPATKIGKYLKLTREQISYKIKKFESEGIIRGYLPLLNNSRLGYSILTLVLFKFKDQLSMTNFKNKVKDNKNRLITVETLAKYDLAVLLTFRDEKERNEVINDLVSSYSKEILDYSILEPYFSEYYPLKFLNERELPSRTFHEYKKEIYNLDNKEKELLKILSKNANLSIIDISKKTNLSSELILYKIRKLREENVIIGTRAYYDMGKIGFFYTLILINFNNQSKNNQEKLRKFAKDNGSVDSLMLLMGKPNCYMQLFHKTEEDLRNFIIDFKNHFKEESFNLEIIPLKNEGEDINVIPFL